MAAHSRSPRLAHAAARSRAALLLALAVLGGGCASVQPELGQMAQAYSMAVEEHERNEMLLNILRASNTLPMHFTTIATMLGQGTLSATSKLSALVSPLSEGQLASELQSSRRFDFTLSSLNNQQFTKGFLADIAVGDLHVLDSSGQIPRELLYMLLFNRVTVHSRGEALRVMTNSGAPADFASFEQAVAELVKAGLRTESYRRSMIVGPELTRPEAATIVGDSLRNLQNLLDLPEGEWFSLQTVPGTTDRYRVQVRALRNRFCMDPPSRAASAFSGLGAGIDCRPDVLAEAAPSAPIADSLRIDLRSTRDVLRYLGTLVREQLRERDPWVARLSRGTFGGDARTILQVRRGAAPAGSKVIAQTQYFGETFHVPMEDSGLSAQVFEMLSILMALNKVPGSVPASPGVLLR